jgi:hypothetical protein
LVQAALALARILDSPRALSSQPAAARVLAALMDKLHTAGAQRRRGNLAVVRTMTEKDACLMADFHAADRPSLPPVE